MSLVRNIVKLTQRQWEELYKTGKTIDSQGVVHNLDTSGDTLYNSEVYDEVIALNNKIDMKLSPLTNEEIVVDEISSYVENIINSDSSLQNKSYFVFTCELSKNNDIKYDSLKNGKIFINNIETTKTYINVKDKNELCRVVVFANDSTLDLSEEPNFELLGNILFNIKNQPIIFNLKYQKGVNKIIAYGTSSSLSQNGNYNILEHHSKGIYDFPQIPSNLDEVYSDITEIPAGTSYFGGGSSSQLNHNKLYFPELKVVGCIASSSSNGFANNLVKIISFPKVERLEGRTGTSGAGSFFNVKADITIPETCMYIGNYLFNGTDARITLNCKHAVIENLWIYNNNTNYKITVCEDWQASVNFSKLSTSSTPLTWYEDVIKNKLANVVELGGRQMTVPTSIYTSLNTTLCDIEGYTDKTWVQYSSLIGWTIIGG